MQYDVNITANAEQLKKVQIEPNLILLESFSSLRIMSKDSWLRENLSSNFNLICADNDNSGGIIENIDLLGDDNTGKREIISIGLYRPCNGIWTALCPEIIGCLAQGSTKREALNNLCTTLAECVVLNYDILGKSPFSSGAQFTSVDTYNDMQHYSPLEILRLLNLNVKFAYLTSNNVIIKTENNPQITITIPNKIISPLTKCLIIKLAQSN